MNRQNKYIRPCYQTYIHIVFLYEINVDFLKLISFVSMKKNNIAISEDNKLLPTSPLISFLKYAEDNQIPIDIYNPNGFNFVYRGIAYNKGVGDNPQLGRYTVYTKLLHVFEPNKCLIRVYNPITRNVPPQTSGYTLLPDYAQMEFEYIQNGSILPFKACSQCKNGIQLDVVSMLQEFVSIDAPLKFEIFKNHTTGFYQITSQNRYLQPSKLSLYRLDNQKGIQSTFQFGAYERSQFPITIGDIPFEWEIIPCDNGKFKIRSASGKRQYVQCFVNNSEKPIGFLILTKEDKYASCFQLRFPKVYRDGINNQITYPWNMYIYRSDVQSYFEQPLIIELDNHNIDDVSTIVTKNYDDADNQAGSFPVMLRGVYLYYIDTDSNTTYDFTCVKNSYCQLPRQKYFITMSSFGEGITENKQTSTFFCNQDYGIHNVVALYRGTDDEMISKMPYINRYDINDLTFIKDRFDMEFCKSSEFNMMIEPFQDGDESKTITAAQAVTTPTVNVPNTFGVIESKNMEFLRGLYLGKAGCSTHSLDEYKNVVINFSEVIFKEDLRITHKTFGKVCYYFNQPLADIDLCSNQSLVRVDTETGVSISESKKGVSNRGVTLYTMVGTGQYASTRCFYRDITKNLLFVSKSDTCVFSFRVTYLCDTDTYVIQNEEMTTTFWYVQPSEVESFEINLQNGKTDIPGPVLHTVEGNYSEFVVEPYGRNSIVLAYDYIGFNSLTKRRYYICFASDYALVITDDRLKATPIYSDSFSYSTMHKVGWESMFPDMKPTQTIFQLSIQTPVVSFVPVILSMTLPNPEEEIFFAYDIVTNTFRASLCDFCSTPFQIYPVLPDMMSSEESVSNELLGVKIRILSQVNKDIEKAYLCSVPNLSYKNLTNVGCNSYYLSRNDLIYHGVMDGQYMQRNDVLGIVTEYVIAADPSSFDCSTGKYKYFMYTYDDNMKVWFIAHDLNPAENNYITLVSEEEKDNDTCLFNIEKVIEDGDVTGSIHAYKISFTTPAINGIETLWNMVLMDKQIPNLPEVNDQQMNFIEKVPLFTDKGFNSEIGLWELHPVKNIGAVTVDNVSKNIHTCYLVVKNEQEKGMLQIVGNDMVEIIVYPSYSNSIKNSDVWETLEGFVDNSAEVPSKQLNRGLQLYSTDAEYNDGKYDNSSQVNDSKETGVGNNAFKSKRKKNNQAAYEAKKCSSEECDMKIKHEFGWLWHITPPEKREACFLGSKIAGISDDKSKKWVPLPAKGDKMVIPLEYVDWEILVDNNNLVATTVSIRKKCLSKGADSFIIVHLEDIEQYKDIEKVKELYPFVQEDGSITTSKSGIGLKSRIDEIINSKPAETYNVFLVLYSTINVQKDEKDNYEIKTIENLKSNLKYATQNYILIPEKDDYDNKQTIYVDPEYGKSISKTPQVRTYKYAMWGWLAVSISIIASFIAKAFLIDKKLTKETLYGITLVIVLGASMKIVDKLTSFVTSMVYHFPLMSNRLLVTIVYVLIALFSSLLIFRNELKVVTDVANLAVKAKST